MSMTPIGPECRPARARSPIPNPTFENPAWEESPFRLLILRLSSFRDVERSTPHLFLAREARRGLPDSYIDMAFLPEPAQRRQRKEVGRPLISGVQSGRPLQDFDLALISHSCVPELANLPLLLEGSRVPLWAGERGPDFPAIILGGSSSAAAAAVTREDGGCMADALFFGEGEGAVERIAAGWRRSADMPKRERLAALARTIPGLWPWGDRGGSTVRARAADGAAPPPIGFHPVLAGEEAGTARLEITRGCPCLCSFCFEAHDRKPFRQVGVQEVLREARELKAGTGAGTLEISSFNFNTHDGIGELLLKLNELFLRVNAMSQRVDILARDRGLLEAEMAAGKRSFTLGIEGISGRQRRFLHKSLSQDDIRLVLARLHAPGIREVKLFFLLTGREEEADFAEFAGLIRFLKETRRRSESNPRLIFSFGFLVRMPFTPLGYDGLILDERRLRPLAGRAKSLCETGGFEFRLSSSWTDYLLIQLIAMGGARAGSLLTALAGAGIAYDKEFPRAARAVAEAWMVGNPSLMKELAEEKPPDYSFGLEFLGTEEERAFLHSQFEKAKTFTDDGYCREGYPDGCGECPSCTMGKKTAVPRSFPAREIADLMERKSRLRPLYVMARIPEEAASWSREWQDAFLMRAFFARFPAEADNLLSIRECLIGPWTGEGRRPSWHGYGIAEMTAWNNGRLLEVLSGASWPDGGVVFAPEENPGLSAPPAAFASADLCISSSAAGPAGLEELILDALRLQHARFTVARRGNETVIIAAEQTAKKKIIFGGGFIKNEKGAFFTLKAGWKLDIRRLLSGLPDASLEIKGLELG